MKSRNAFLVTSLLLALILAACSRAVATPADSGQSNQPAPLPTQDTSNQPSNSRAPEFYTESFEGDTSNWTYEFSSGSEADTEIYVEDGNAIYVYKAEGIQTYTLYDPYTYTDVKVEATVQNRGVNNHFISLVCRWTDSGHYEAVISGSGLYWIYGFGNGAGSDLKSGASNEIKAGKVENTYTFVCSGQTLTLYANGKQIARIDDTAYGLTEGQVGFGLASQTAWPVDMAFEAITISEP